MDQLGRIFKSGNYVYTNSTVPKHDVLLIYNKRYKLLYHCLTYRLTQNRKRRLTSIESSSSSWNYVVSPNFDQHLSHKILANVYVSDCPSLFQVEGTKENAFDVMEKRERDYRNPWRTLLKDKDYTNCSCRHTMLHHHAWRGRQGLKKRNCKQILELN